MHKGYVSFYLGDAIRCLLACWLCFHSHSLQQKQWRRTVLVLLTTLSASLL